MGTTGIRTGTSLATLINDFTVDPARQGELVELLDRATEQAMRHRPGFVAAHLHASEDGTHVVNYVQWQRREDHEAMLADPACREHMGEAMRIATCAPRFYAVVATHHR